ncbi:hypothetical protein ACXGQW_06440 [Wenyingzhuangia sp. IMCC45533]
MLKTTYYIGLVFVMLCNTSNAQKKYDFESTSSWKNANTNQFEISPEQASNGTNSLKFTIPQDGVLDNKAIHSIETGHTIMKVRTATVNNKDIIVASDYNGAMLGIDYSGAILWKNDIGQGVMNHDVWCDDLTGDGKDEILVASANGTVYCLDSDGKKMWDFKPYESDHLTPMYAVCVVKDASLNPYVVCGNFDTNCYYLSPTGNLVKTLPSIGYSKVRPWGTKNIPKKFLHHANFLRPIPQADGSDLLFMQATNNHMQSNGDNYIFVPLADTPIQSIVDVNTPDVVGDVRVEDPDGDGVYEVLLGTSTLSNNGITVLNTTDYNSVLHEFRNVGPTSYRVNQVFTIPNGSSYQYAVVTGSYILLLPPDLDEAGSERIVGTYSYNDAWKDADENIILGSSQDGGSCIHVINMQNDGWKTEFANLVPPGNISKILANTQTYRNNLNGFTKPSWETEGKIVYSAEGSDNPVAQSITNNPNYNSPVFLNYVWHRGRVQDVNDWDRNTIYDGNPFRDKRDRRNNYVLTQSEVVNTITPSIDNGPNGASFWGGHGNDPLFYSPSTLETIINHADTNGNKKIMMIYPEMNGSGEGFDQVMDDHIYPLADYAKTRNSNIYIRNKDVFWQGAAYLPAWSRMISGEFSSVFVSSLEETTDKTQDMSLLGRMGLWASGALDNWGMRCSRDNPTFDRSRQISYQRLNNHFLRTMVYSMAYGANFLNVTYVNPEHQSFAWELVAKGALYVPKREQILSFNPVHLSIHEPQEHYLNEAENNKWTTFYDRDYEENNPAVFSHMNGSWLGATVTKWDFSSYASGVKDRRQNFIPSYPNGSVLITPVQNGALADASAPRGKMEDHMHPIYRNILKEYITDGIDYISADGNTKFDADTYYTQIKQDIEAGANQLPITVSGDQVGWVVAQTSPTHLRLTLVDGGYINPSDRQVTVKFNTVSPVAVKDLLDNKTFNVINGVAKVDVPCGMFRFIDVELSSPLN